METAGGGAREGARRTKDEELSHLPWGAFLKSDPLIPETELSPSPQPGLSFSHFSHFPASGNRLVLS